MDKPDSTDFAFMSFLLLNQQQIHENIKFADQKAIAIGAINAALIGFLFQKNVTLRRLAS